MDTQLLAHHSLLISLSFPSCPYLIGKQQVRTYTEPRDLTVSPAQGCWEQALRGGLTLPPCGQEGTSPSSIASE